MRNYLEPIWSQYPSEKPPAAIDLDLVGDVDVDVAVIGGGFTGLSTALALSEAGRSVLLLDAGPIPGEDSSRTTAHLTEAVDARYHQLTSDFGVEGARLVGQSSRAAIEKIYGWVSRYGINCQFERVPGFLYAESASDQAMLQQELQSARRAGLDVGWCQTPPLPFPVAGAIEFREQAQLHAGSYLNGLVRAIRSHGGRLLPYTPVLEIEDGTPSLLRTAQARIHAQEVIVATHTPVSHRIQLQTRLAAYRTYAIAVSIENAHRRPGSGLFWDTANPYHYTRAFRDAQQSGWIIGGQDHRTGDRIDTHDPIDQLKAYARSRFGSIQVLAEWSGQVHESVDGLPYIGQTSHSEHVWVATGFAGNGTTFGTVAALILADAILGRVNPWARLYSARRLKPLASAATFIEENLRYPRCLISDRLRPAEAHSPAEIAPGEGKLLKTEGSDERIAAYRDDSGVLYQVSAVCPHMGCLVRFNTAERTWDCPCHGSRFATDGRVLNGPSLSGLEPKAPVQVPAREGRPEKPEEGAA